MRGAERVHNTKTVRLWWGFAVDTCTDSHFTWTLRLSQTLTYTLNLSHQITGSILIYIYYLYFLAFL